VYEVLHFVEGLSSPAISHPPKLWKVLEESIKDMSLSYEEVAIYTAFYHIFKEMDL
jgi:hypothetical protein